MKRFLLAPVAVAALLPASLRAQDLAPRAYTITPRGSNAITVSYIFNSGDLLFEGTVPITDASASSSSLMPS